MSLIPDGTFELFSNKVAEAFLGRASLRLESLMASRIISGKKGSHDSHVAIFCSVHEKRKGRERY